MLMVSRCPSSFRQDSAYPCSDTHWHSAPTARLYHRSGEGLCRVYASRNCGVRASRQCRESQRRLQRWVEATGGWRSSGLEGSPEVSFPQPLKLTGFGFSLYNAGCAYKAISSTYHSGWLPKHFWLEGQQSRAAIASFSQASLHQNGIIAPISCRSLCCSNPCCMQNLYIVKNMFKSCLIYKAGSL